MKNHLPEEISYIDLLHTLHDMVYADAIPKEEKEEILNTIFKLEATLEKYSA